MADFEPELNIGDWSNGMIGVSKTFGGGSIPSSPGVESTGNVMVIMFPVLLFTVLLLILGVLVAIQDVKKLLEKSDDKAVA